MINKPITAAKPVWFYCTLLKKGLFCFVALLFFLAANAQTTQTATATAPVNIESGMVAGKLLPGGVRAYLAIPYAAPPVGELRWREPQAVKPWKGVRTADEYCAPCAQRGNANEDCLYLNLWAPAKQGKKKLPVIVYIYGAGFSGGSAADKSLAGEKLAAKGVIYVNFNYRLGIFASLSHPELSAESPFKTSGNYSRLDELALLKWVKRNIARFGGDPDNVTLMGQSSGAIDVCCLQASPLTKGLINKVVGLSGGGFQAGGPWPGTPLKEAEQMGIRFQQKTGAKSLKELRDMPVEKLLQGGGMWVPVGPDGYVLLKPVPETFASHEQTDVPAMLNCTRDEGFGILGRVKNLDEYKQAVQRVAGVKADELLKLYPASTDEEARKAGVKAGHEAEFGKQMVLWASAQSKGRAPSYLSVFSRGNPASHTMDVPYWLGNIKLPDANDQSKSVITSYDVELADKMSDVLVAFAKTGNPDTGIVKWPQYNDQNPERMDFGDTIRRVPADKGIYFFIANADIQIGMGAGGGPRPGRPAQ